MMAYRKQKAQCLYRLGLAVLGYENISTAGESLALQRPNAPAVEGKKPQDTWPFSANKRQVEGTASGPPAVAQ